MSVAIKRPTSPLSLTNDRDPQTATKESEVFVALDHTFGNTRKALSGFESDCTLLDNYYHATIV